MFFFPLTKQNDLFGHAGNATYSFIFFIINRPSGCISVKLCVGVVAPWCSGLHICLAYERSPHRKTQP